MGQYWEIACTDKKQYFRGHPFKCGVKLREFFTDKNMINALLYLITVTDEKDGLSGRWAGMNVTIVGDYGDYDEDRFPSEENGWVDIGDELSNKVFSDGVPKDDDLEWRVTCKHEKEEFVTMRAGDPLLFYLITDREANGHGGGDLKVDDDDGLYFGRWSCFPHSIISATVTKKRRREEDGAPTKKRRREEDGAPHSISATVKEDGDITAEATRAKERALEINFGSGSDSDA